ncbi:MAG: quinolinate synthase NadA [Oscillospiraceae bacterium]|jgi:quinolinate synthase|nr:quinolinate synthase NadA [Oscillospiraceae bacterium]
MTIREVQEEILRLKREKDICVLAHSYQAREILEIADHTGDSYKLSVLAAGDKRPTAIMCGVRFMAETVKLLSPSKTVYLANETAGCPMADGLSAERLQKAIAKYPDAAVVCYINTTAEVKTLSDVCVTSSSAVKIIRAMGAAAKEILFVPDCNLGAYVASQVPETTVRLISGGCPIHAAVTAEDVAAARAAHPDALLLVHPECVPDVVERADYVGSTSGIFDCAAASDRREFIIGTEVSIAEHLQYACPEKRFYALSKKLMCHNMKATTLMDVYHCLNGAGGDEITMEPELIAGARRCIDEMIRLGGK